MINTTHSKQKLAAALSLAAMIAGFSCSVLSAPKAPVDTAILSVTVNPANLGSVSPNDNDKLLQVGKTYSLAAKAAKGCAFTGWSGDTNSSSSKITFVMQPGRSFTANFADITRPVLAIMSPKAKQSVAGSSLTVTGKASDNVGVTAVYYQLNGGDWAQASGTTSWTSTDLPLAPGTNVVSAFATDAAGNASLTNKITFVHPVTFTGIYRGETNDDVSGNGGFVLFVDSKNNALVIGGDPFNNDAGNQVYGSCTAVGGEGNSSLGNNSLSFQINTNGQVDLTVTAPFPWQISGTLVSDGPFKSIAGTYTAKVSGQTVQAILSPDGWFYLSSPGHGGGSRGQFTAFGQPVTLMALGHTSAIATPNSNATISLTGGGGSGNVNVTMKRTDALP